MCAKAWTASHGGVRSLVNGTGSAMARDTDEQSAEISQDPPQLADIAGAAAPPGKLLGRAQAARMLGVSKSTLRRMEGECLTPVVGPRNVRLFHEEQIHSLVVTRRSEVGARSAGGELAAEAFQLFDDDTHPVDVVKKLRVEPDVIQSLHERWTRMRSMLTLSGQAIRSLHDNLCEDEHARVPASEPELLALVAKWVRDISPRRCDRCRSESAAFCRACAREWGLMAAKGELADRRARRI